MRPLLVVYTSGTYHCLGTRLLCCLSLLVGLLAVGRLCKKQVEGFCQVQRCWLLSIDLLGFNQLVGRCLHRLANLCQKTDPAMHMVNKTTLPRHLRQPTGFGQASIKSKCSKQSNKNPIFFLFSSGFEPEHALQKNAILTIELRELFFQVITVGYRFQAIKAPLRTSPFAKLFLFYFYLNIKDICI